MITRYLFYCPKRSGHHAIIFWLLEHTGPATPILEGKIFYAVTSDAYFYNDSSRHKYNVTNDCRIKIRNYEDALPGDESILEPAALDHTPCPVMTDTRVLVLRDFLNLWASTSSHPDLKDQPDSDFPNLVQRWKAFARLFAQTDQDDRIIRISYNRWLSDRAYRDHVAQLLGFENKEQLPADITHRAGSSSWLGQEDSQNVERYLTRYKHLIPTIQERELILQDTELIQLNRDIFGLDLPQMMSEL